MISAWDVYWVMQADTIRTLFFLVTVAAGAVTVITLLIGAIYRDDHEQGSDGYGTGVRMHRITFFASIFLVIFGALTAFMPNSKTLAAMYVLPAITSDQVVQPLTTEAKELYGLAKQAVVATVGQNLSARDSQRGAAETPSGNSGDHQQESPPSGR